MDPGGKKRPYVGIRVERGTGHGTQLLESLRSAVDRGGVRGLDIQRNNRYWPAYSFIERDSDWWRDIATWREGVIERFVAAWSVAAPLIDEALTKLDAPDDATDPPHAS